MCTRCYKLAGEAGRYRILALLKKKPRTVSELTRLLEVSQPTVSHHLRLLSEAGLVRGARHGRLRRYSLCMGSECFAACGLLEGLG